MYGNEFSEFESLMEDVDMEMVGAVIGVLAIFAVIAMILALVFYVLKSLGMYTIAKRRGIDNPWLAWLPIGNEWIAGAISDNYNLAAKGQNGVRRFIMLGLAVAGVVLSWFSSGVSMDNLMQIMESAAYAEDPSVMMSVAGDSAVSGLVGLLGGGVSLASVVFWVMSMYDLYSSCCPQNSVLFTVLGFFFGFLEPFFIFCNRNKDEGMPQTVTEQPVWQAPQPAQLDWQTNRVEGDPWDNNPEA